MREYLKKIARWLNLAGFWAAVLLVLPNCGLSTSGIGQKPLQNLDQGDNPTSAIFCAIEKWNGRHCPANQAEIDNAIRFSDAAIALTEERTAKYGLDDTEVGLGHCPGTGEIVEFEGDAQYPWGVLVCLNCGQIGSTYTNAIDVCRARCYDYRTETLGDTVFVVVPPEPSVKTFCDAHSIIATNGIPPEGGCYPGICTSEGIPSGAGDPRRFPEPVKWTQEVGAQPGLPNNENDLQRTAISTGAYDAGAVSAQLIERGTAYVEFEVNDSDQSHVLGLSSVAGCPDPCVDSSQSDTTIGFAIKLHSDNRLYIYESGNKIPGQDIDGSWWQYYAGERFRITLRANLNGTTDVIYSQHYGEGATCIPDPCVDHVLYEHPVQLSQFPFRVDTSLRDEGAALINVRIVRIYIQ